MFTRTIFKLTEFQFVIQQRSYFGPYLELLVTYIFSYQSVPESVSTRSRRYSKIYTTDGRSKTTKFDRTLLSIFKIRKMCFQFLPTYTIFITSQHKTLFTKCTSVFLLNDYIKESIVIQLKAISKAAYKSKSHRYKGSIHM